MKYDTPQQIIEYFHLLFLMHLSRVLAQHAYVLKGGCNLRFFMKSIRYSENLDLDLQILSKETLTKNVDKVLASPILQKTLKARGIELKHCSKPKQTETTQRWKVLLQTQSMNLSIPTKIEFSRRGIEGGYTLEHVDPEILQPHALFPIFTQHYTLAQALKQKIEALAQRRETQCRDVFDIEHLLCQGATISLEDVKPLIHEAMERCTSLSFSDYKSQVVTFLEKSYQEVYGSPETWDKINWKVFAYLDQLR